MSFHTMSRWFLVNLTMKLRPRSSRLTSISGRERSVPLLASLMVSFPPVNVSLSTLLAFSLTTSPTYTIFLSATNCILVTLDFLKGLFLMTTPSEPSQVTSDLTASGMNRAFICSSGLLIRLKTKPCSPWSEKHSNPPDGSMILK